MIEKRFIFIQDGNLHTVIDNDKNIPLGVFEFKDDECPQYYWFHEIIDLLNDFDEDNKQLESDIFFCKMQNNEMKEILDDNRSMMEVVLENKQLKEQLKQFKVLSEDYNISFDKMHDTFESCLERIVQLESLVKSLQYRDNDILKEYNTFWEQKMKKAKIDRVI